MSGPTDYMEASGSQICRDASVELLQSAVDIVSKAYVGKCIALNPKPYTLNANPKP